MRQLKIAFGLFLLFHLSKCCVFPRDEDEFRTTCQLIESRHFICEEHKVVTEDGYILTLHRIVHPNASSAHLEPVLLGHGLGASSSCWIFAAPGENNLGFVLANQGWDTWLANFRGTRYSQQHVKLNNGPGKYWRFSFDEMIKYDTPAFIHFILNKTGRATLAYIGHSQGTTIMTGFLSTNPGYGKVIKPYIALAPVAYVENTSAAIRLLADIPNAVSLLSLYDGPVDKDHALIKLISSLACNPLDSLCSGFFLLFGGINPNSLNGRVYVYIRQQDTVSSQDLVHYGQNIADRNFEFYNPNPVGILSPVGLISILTPISMTSLQPKVAAYPLEDIISLDIHLIASCNDYLAVSEDIDRLVRKLKACDLWKLNGLVVDILESYRTGHWKSSLGYSSKEEEIESLCRSSCPATNTITNIFGSNTPRIVDGLNDVLGGLGSSVLRSANLKTLTSAIAPALAIF
uniref:Partial AB-hydrolase lipase domain-containing protein n=1 Tax=Tetranychus urticae TaxID=32264 RepID=T1JZF8_TETUR